MVEVRRLITADDLCFCRSIRKFQLMHLTDSDLGMAARSVSPGMFVGSLIGGSGHAASRPRARFICVRRWTLTPARMGG
jgi:hypothetical protein